MHKLLKKPLSHSEERSDEESVIEPKEVKLHSELYFPVLIFKQFPIL
jgi:hypothetical protein